MVQASFALTETSRMSKRHQEPTLVFRELKPKMLFLCSRSFKCLKSRELSFGKPQAAPGFWLKPHGL